MSGNGNGNVKDLTITKGPGGLATVELSTVGAIEQFAQWMATNSAKGGGMPKGYPNVETLTMGIYRCVQAGLPPTAVAKTYWLNGNVVMHSEAVWALVTSQSGFHHFEESSEGEGDALTYITKIFVMRADVVYPVKGEFSVGDAKKAGLWGKQGPWSSYPKRMLQMRARTFAARDAFPGVFVGIQCEADVEGIAKPSGQPSAATRSAGLAAKLHAAANPVEAEAIEVPFEVVPQDDEANNDLSEELNYVSHIIQSSLDSGLQPDDVKRKVWADWWGPLSLGMKALVDARGGLKNIWAEEMKKWTEKNSPTE